MEKPMRNISFALTTAQFRDRSKSITRRRGWWDLEVDEELMGVEKSQGLKKGERVVKLGQILIRDVRIEKLNRLELESEYGAREMIREGFPGLPPAEFVYNFCISHKCKPWDDVNRIEFAYMGPTA
jgi:hypothetical protein